MFWSSLLKDVDLGFSWVEQNTNKCFVLVDDVWNEEAAMSAKVYDHRMSLTDMGVFRTGGYEDVDYGATSSTEYFQNGIWTAGPKLPGGLYKHCQVTIGSTVYVAGIKIMRNPTKIFEFVSGGHFNGDFFNPHLFALENQNGSWIKMADMKHGRADAGCIEFDGKLWMIGGYSNTSEFYDPTTNIWTEGPLYPAGHPNDHVFEFDGTLYAMNDWNLMIYKLDLKIQEWIGVQQFNLSESSWQHWKPTPLVHPQTLHC